MASGDLCAVADVQAFLSLSAGQDSTLLQSLVSSASAFIDSYLGRTTLSASYTETRNGSGGARLGLRQYPVSDVVSVTVDGVSIPKAADSIGSGYSFDENLVYLRGYCFARGVQNVTVQYSAGYVSAPADLAQACVEIVAAKYKRRTELHLHSKAMDGQTISFNTNDLPPSAEGVLAMYQRQFLT